MLDGEAGARDGDPRSDEELVAAANAGDGEAFAAIYRRYRDWAFRVAWRIVRDPEAARDAVQEAFRRALRQFPGFVLRSRLTTWLYVLVKNEALMARRQAARAGPETLFEPPDPVEAGAFADEEEARAVLAAAIAALPEAQRETVLLRFVDGLALDAIAEALEIPLGTVKSRLHHALARLAADPRLKTLIDG